MRLWILVIAATGFLSTNFAASQLRVGVVDLQRVMFYYDEFKVFRIEMANREARYTNELSQDEAEVNRLKQMLQDPSLGEDKKEGLEKDYSRKVFNMQRKFETYKKKIEEQKEEQMEKIKAVIFEEISKIAKVKRMDFVFDKRSVYYGNTEDFTQQLIDRINKKSGGRASAGKR
ncbi:MAG: OmpH family outer membrane protein [bacterium]|nr:OmpH family outer membrane protein [bacterium]